MLVVLSAVAQLCDYYAGYNISNRWLLCSLFNVRLWP